MRVKNNLIADASAGNKYISAMGRGRDLSYNIDYSHCVPGVPCLRLGNNTDGPATAGGARDLSIVIPTTQIAPEALSLQLKLQITSSGRGKEMSSLTPTGAISYLKFNSIFSFR